MAETTSTTTTPAKIPLQFQLGDRLIDSATIRPSTFASLAAAHGTVGMAAVPFGKAGATAAEQQARLVNRLRIKPHVVSFSLLHAAQIHAASLDWIS